jgi:hypothetical protein
MSVIRSKTVTVEITRTSSDRKALRPSARATHDTTCNTSFSSGDVQFDVHFSGLALPSVEAIRQ